MHHNERTELLKLSGFDRYYKKDATRQPLSGKAHILLITPAVHTKWKRLSSLGSNSHRSMTA